MYCIWHVHVHVLTIAWEAICDRNTSDGSCLVNTKVCNSSWKCYSYNTNYYSTFKWHTFNPLTCCIWSHNWTIWLSLKGDDPLLTVPSATPTSVVPPSWLTLDFFGVGFDGKCKLRCAINSNTTHAIFSNDLTLMPLIDMHWWDPVMIGCS